jgi:hypothetical protein
MAGTGFLQVEVQGLEDLQKFSNWGPALDEWMTIALRLSLDHLFSSAQDYMSSKFKHPTGTLEHNFIQQIYSSSMPVSGALVNDSPYAWRREQGFSGMTDSLGRHFTNDPGIYYMEYTLENETDWIRKTFSRSLDSAWKELALTSINGPIISSTTY